MDEKEKFNGEWLLRKEADLREDSKDPKAAFMRDHLGEPFDSPPKKGNKMKKFVVTNDNAKDLEFEGELIANFDSYPGYLETGKWLELNLYKTRARKFICQKVYKTQWEKESDSFKATVANSEKGVIAFFGMSDAAKELYESAGIDATEKVG